MKINVDISVCLSSVQEIEVPDNYEYDPITLIQYVREQVKLPQDILNEYSSDDWIVDDMCVQ